MSVEAVDLAVGGQQATTLLDMLDSSTPRLHVVTATSTRIVSMRATYQGDAFVMAGGVVGGDTVSALVGPAAALPGEIGQLLQTLSEATSVPLSPRFNNLPVLVPDALVLADDVRAGAFDDLGVALRVAGLGTIPTWLGDLAHGVSATFLILVSDLHETRLGTHLIGLPCGWGRLRDVDGKLSMQPMDHDQILTEVEDVTLVAASLAR